MKYQDLPPIDRDEAVGILAGDDDDLAVRALLRAALNDADRGWIEAQCVQQLRHASLARRCAAVTSIGHVARIFRAIGDECRSSIVALCSSGEEALRGRAHDAREDIAMFVDRRRR